MNMKFVSNVLFNKLVVSLGPVWQILLIYLSPLNLDLTRHYLKAFLYYNY